MGVPALFRWLSSKYPKIISPVVEEQAREIDGQVIPVDTTKPNPNGEEMDNLYLDMNGIVHPCTHPEGRPPPANEAEMMVEIFKYTDRVVNMVRPRKLLMIAVDGVAPRAKMNQQRSRRFRSAQEAKEADEKKAEFVKLLRKQNKGKALTMEEEVIEKTWDSNVITPGTPFMDILALSLRYWVAYKLNTDPAWEKLKIIISDATVPGEGEHKIMEFIRSQRSCPEHDPNTRHVIYGLDADLIMLGLGTHEPHFRVLREDVFFQEGKAKTCHLCGQKGHMAEACTGKPKEKSGEFDEKDNASPLKPFIWLHVSVLREYLAVELNVPNQPFPFDLERALDDWVFMCFFVGNDFLPHLPSLDIRENGIDTLIAIWRDNLPIMGGYLTKDGHVDLARAQIILQGLAKQEDAIFRRRRQTEERRQANAKRRKEQEQERDRNRNGQPQPKKSRKSLDMAPPAEEMGLMVPGKGHLSRAERELTHAMVVNRGAIYKANMANKSAAAALKSQLASGTESQSISVTANSEMSIDSSPSALGKRKADLLESDAKSDLESGSDRKPQNDEEAPDTVRLWEAGYADRYYEQKFKVDPRDHEFRHKVARAYVEGLCWVLLYYFQGCPSWTWYYPYHYAPFAADFVDLDKMDIKFDKGKPFKPFEQLMGVLPAASNHAIPEVFHSLMTDPESEIIDFYPEDFPIDLNGKKFAWQGVVLLPFIDERRLLAAMDKRYHLLTADEKTRNEMGKDVLLISDRHPLYKDLTSTFYSKKQSTSKLKLNMRVSEGLGGKVERNEAYIPHSSLVPPVDGVNLPTLDEDHSISVVYEIPKSMYTHKSMLLRGVKLSAPVLDKTDIEVTRSKARTSGRSYGGVPFRAENSRGRGRGRGGQMSYAPDRANPFAAHINPNFVPPPPQWGVPPPPPPGWPYPPGMNAAPYQPPQDDRYRPAGGYYQPPPPPGRGGYRGPPPPPGRDQYRPPRDYNSSRDYSSGGQHGSYGGPPSGGYGQRGGRGGGSYRGDQPPGRGGYSSRGSGGYGRY